MRKYNRKEDAVKRKREARTDFCREPGFYAGSSCGMAQQFLVTRHTTSPLSPTTLLSVGHTPSSPKRTPRKQDPSTIYQGNTRHSIKQPTLTQRASTRRSEMALASCHVMVTLVWEENRPCHYSFQKPITATTKRLVLLKLHSNTLEGTEKACTL